LINVQNSRNFQNNEIISQHSARFTLPKLNVSSPESPHSEVDGHDHLPQNLHLLESGEGQEHPAAVDCKERSHPLIPGLYIPSLVNLTPTTNFETPTTLNNPRNAKPKQV